MITIMHNLTEIDAEIEKARAEIDSICKLIDAARDQMLEGKPITEAFDMLELKYNEASEKLAAFERTRSSRLQRAGVIREFVKAIEADDFTPDDFSEEVWTATIDHVTTYPDNTLLFTFKNGQEVRVGV